VKIITHVRKRTSRGAVLHREVGMNIKVSIQALTFSGQIVDPKGEMNLKKKTDGVSIPFIIRHREISMVC
jgi:hypothetical protein